MCNKRSKLNGTVKSSKFKFLNGTTPKSKNTTTSKLSNAHYGVRFLVCYNHINLLAKNSWWKQLPTQDKRGTNAQKFRPPSDIKRYPAFKTSHPTVKNENNISQICVSYNAYNQFLSKISKS